MGGYINDKGEFVLTFNVPIEEQIVYYNAQAPSSIKTLYPLAISLGDFEFDGHGEPVNAVFEISCACGGKRFHAIAHEGEDGWFDDPVSLKCSSCREETVIFNGRQHGYDGALGHNNRVELPLSDRVELIGNDIGDPPYGIFVRFEYSSDQLGDKDFADWKGRESELYSWITIVARRPETSEMETIFEQECA